jgi:hypothetical protein
VSGEHAFEDAGQSPEREGDEVGNRAHVAARPFRVSRQERVAGGETGRQRGVVVDRPQAILDNRRPAEVTAVPALSATPSAGKRPTFFSRLGIRRQR